MAQFPTRQVEEMNVAFITDAFQVLPRHIAISLAASSIFLLTFCATRNAFYLRFLPCLVVGEIGRIVVIWTLFLFNTREAEFMRDMYLLIAGRVRTEVYKTKTETGWRRRRTEAQFLGAIHKYHGFVQSYAETYLDKLAADAKWRREVNTRDFLSALHQGLGDTEEAIGQMKERFSRFHQTNHHKSPRMITLSHVYFRRPRKRKATGGA